MSEQAHDLPRQYTFEHRMTPERWGSIHYDYIIRGPIAAVHLHISDMGEKGREHGGPRFSGGIEIHHRTMQNNEAPSHEKCWAIGGPCWHEGSSTWAERFVDMHEQREPDPLVVFRRLLVEVAEYLEEHRDE